MKTWEVIMTTAGRAKGLVQADTKEEARTRALEGVFLWETEKQIEWENVEIESIEEEEE